jgi:hypothetical protein
VPPEPGPLPLPPDDLRSRPLPLTTVGAPWYRLHPPRRDPVHFGREPTSRFNAPSREFGVLYLASDPACAFIEVFGRVNGPSFVEPAQLSRRRLAEIRPPRPLRLVDLTGSGLARIGADARLFAGDHTVARRWSLALFQHPASPDGLLYPARHDPSLRAAAVFDRVKGRWRAKDLGRLDDPGNRALLAGLLHRYGYGFLG